MTTTKLPSPYGFWLMPKFSTQIEKEAIDVSLWLQECTELVAEQIKRKKWEEPT